MAISKRSRIGIFSALIGVLLILVFAPLLIPRAVRFWFWWKTRGTGVTITTDAIEAPFLRPIVLHGLRIQTGSAAAVRIDATARRVVLGLNLRAILLRTRGPILRSLLADGLHVEMRRNKPGLAFSENGWNTLHRLLPQNFTLQPFDVRWEDGASLMLLRGVLLTGTPMEAGHFEAAEVVVSSPMFRQTFSNLKGATGWQADRLTIAALTLSRGLDVQSITTDLSHLGKRRVALEFDLDAFGGKLRGSVADEWRSRRSNWTMAGSANDISLSQTAEAFGFTDRVGGLLHAGKFTFRGDLAEALSGTASLWVELTGPAWRDREADVIMLGLSLYGRQLELQQLYIKQKRNELTLNGESSFPTTAAGWLRPDFRGNVSASIDDLGDFASLFGGNRNDFAGQIEVEGILNARDRNVGGNLTANGYGLTMFKSSIDEFHAELKLRRDAIEIAQLEFKRQNDLVRAQGKIETSADHDYSGVIDATVENIGIYLPLVYGPLETKPISATLHADVTSSVWETRAVLDPVESKPLVLNATFPLRIGHGLESMWNSPFTATVEAPDLHLAEIPRRPSSASFGNGSLSAQLTISETPRHPKVTGYAQVVSGRFGSIEVSSRLRFDGNRGAIEWLTLTDRQNSASFYGDIDLQDIEQLKVQLFPNQPVYDLNGPMIDCVSTIAVVPAAASQPGAGIEEIDVDRSTAKPNWTVGLNRPGVAGLPNGAWNRLAKTFRLCPGAQPPVASLQVGVQPPPPASPAATPARQRKRKR